MGVSFALTSYQMEEEERVSHDLRNTAGQPPRLPERGTQYATPSPYWATKRVGGPGCDKGFPEVGL